MVRRGRPLSEGAERTPTLRIFRGSRGGMWRKRHRAGRETHDGAGRGASNRGVEGTPKSSRAVVGVGGVHRTDRGRRTTEPCPRERTRLCSRFRRVEDQGMAFVLSTPFTIRTRQRNLSRKAKPESGSLDTGACLLRKNIGKPCMGKPYARFDEGALGYPLSAVVRSRRARRNVREQLQVNTSALLYPYLYCPRGSSTASHGGSISWSIIFPPPG